MPPPPAARAGRFDPLAYRDPHPRAWVIHTVTPFVRHVVLPILRLRSVDLPVADLARLRAAVRPGTIAFLGPAHPEFLTDWMLDKELSSRVSPLMAHWATYGVVNVSPLVQPFWLANNLIANPPGGAGRAYSARWALTGHGVLLHPEGTCTWQAERIAPLVPGIAEMACEAALASGDMRPAWLVPLVYRYAFTGDASRGLHREMGVIERALGLPSGARLALEQRFAALLVTLLARQRAALGLPALDTDARGYFAAQAGTLAALRAALAARYGPLDPDAARALHQLRQAVRARAASAPEGARADRARLDELKRLASLDPALYGRATLSQEQIAECLKRMRSILLVRGARHALANTLPIAVAPRTAHVRAPDPLDVRAALTAAGGDAARAAAALLDGHRRVLQAAQDALGAELAPRMDRFRRPNPLRAGA